MVNKEGNHLIVLIGFSFVLRAAAARQVKPITSIGIGWSISAICGENKLMPLAKKLHIPFVEEAYITGNSYWFEFQLVLVEKMIPKIITPRRYGTSEGMKLWEME